MTRMTEADLAAYYRGTMPLGKTSVKWQAQTEAEIAALHDRTTPQLGPTPPVRERQEGGDHYKKLPIQPFDYSMQNGLDPLQHTVIKYVTRFRDKGGVADLRKAIHCIEMLIEFEDARP